MLIPSASLFVGIIIVIISCLGGSSEAFMIRQPVPSSSSSSLPSRHNDLTIKTTLQTKKNPHHPTAAAEVVSGGVLSSTSLFASGSSSNNNNSKPPTLTPAQQSRRRELLSRSGPHFQLNRFQGTVEFGSSAQLVTKLVDVDPQQQASSSSSSSANDRKGIAEWLESDQGRGLALSIWDEKMMKDLGNSRYRLQTMKLQFVTIQLSPSVDVQMWTQRDPTTTTGGRGEQQQPVFSLQSVDFDPNIQLLPGVGISASSLGIQIDVVGELRPTLDGTGVTGSISFATKGTLPPPLRVLPEAPLKLASNTINDTIVSFAVESFQKGAIRKYQEFRAATRQQV